DRLAFPRLDPLRVERPGQLRVRGRAREEGLDGGQDQGVHAASLLMKKCSARGGGVGRNRERRPLNRPIPWGRMGPDAQGIVRQGKKAWRDRQTGEASAPS